MRIDLIRDPQHILHDVEITQKYSIKEFLDKDEYLVSSELISVGFLPVEMDEGTSMKEYVEQVDINFRLK